MREEGQREINKSLSLVHNKFQIYHILAGHRTVNGFKYGESRRHKPAAERSDSSFHSHIHVLFNLRAISNPDSQFPAEMITFCCHYFKACQDRVRMRDVRERRNRSFPVILCMWISTSHLREFVWSCSRGIAATKSPNQSHECKILSYMQTHEYKGKENTLLLCRRSRARETGQRMSHAFCFVKYSLSNVWPRSIPAFHPCCQRMSSLSPLCLRDLSQSVWKKRRSGREKTMFLCLFLTIIHW